MSDVQEIKRQIHNLTSQQTRLRKIAKDPVGYREKERARYKIYWATLNPEKKKVMIERQSKTNKANRPRINKSQRKTYQKNRDKILAKAASNRIDNPERYRAVQRKTYQKNREKVLQKAKLRREKNGDQMRARERELYKLRKEANK